MGRRPLGVGKAVYSLALGAPRWVSALLDGLEGVEVVERRRASAREALALLAAIALRGPPGDD